MHKYIFLFVVFITNATNLFSQGNSQSPYTRFGIGDIVSKNFGQSKGLGKSSIALFDNEHINIINPATYGSFDSLNFVFEVGLFNNFTKYKTEYSSTYNNNTNLNYLAFGFPITRWWSAAVSLNPYSNVGYNIVTSDSTSHLGKVNYKYVGAGGVNQFIIGNSFKPVKNLYLGVNVSYLFGSLVYSKNADIVENVNSFDYYYYDSTIVKDLYFDFGLLYKFDLKENNYLTIGAIFNNYKNITVSKTSFARLSGNGSTSIIKQSQDEEGIYKFPMNYGLALSYNIDNKLIFTADFITQKWSEAEFFGQTDTMKDSRFISAGIEYIPNKSSINNYFKKIRYRFGGYYSDTYLNLNNNQLNDYGITIGLGLPLRKSKSNLNVSFELGQRGTISNNLIKETYAIVGLNLTLHDFWFMKRKFD